MVWQVAAWPAAHPAAESPTDLPDSAESHPALQGLPVHLGYREHPVLAAAAASDGHPDRPAHPARAYR